MAVERVSATVDARVYRQFEQVALETGRKKSEIVAEALTLWLKSWTDSLIADSYEHEGEEDLLLARASKKKAAQVLAKDRE